MKLLSSDRELAFTSMLGSDWHTRKQKVFNWPSNKSDLRSHHDRLASWWPSHAIRKSIGINSGPRMTTTAQSLWIHLQPSPDWPVMLCDRLATDPRPGCDRLKLPVCLGKSLHEIKISRVTCDRFMIMPNGIGGHRVIYDWPAKTCDQRRIQLRVGSLASEIDKFHNRFWQFKAIVELVDFGGK